jgi:hypothetical protein
MCPGDSAVGMEDQGRPIEGLGQPGNPGEATREGAEMVDVHPDLQVREGSITTDLKVLFDRNRPDTVIRKKTAREAA